MRRTPIRRAAWARANALMAACCLLACGDPAAGPDAAVDAAPATDATDAGAPDERLPTDAACLRDEDCDDGVFCNGAERCLGGACVAPPGDRCDDRRACTRDACDEASRQCTHAPDHAMCRDANDCNGLERCDPEVPGADPTTGCTPVHPDAVLDCNDRNPCTLDSCDPAVGCVHSPRDLDGDAFIDRACTLDGTPLGARGDDCDDVDPAIHPGVPEVCGDGRDNNCDGLVDLQDAAACAPGNDTCASATVLAGPGSYVGSTVGLRDDYAPHCGGAGALDAVFRFTLTAPRDVVIRTTPLGYGSVIALATDCAAVGPAPCTRGALDTNPVLRARALPAGTYYVVVEPGGATSFGLELQIDAPVTPALGDVCPAAGSDPAVEIGDGAPHVARLSTFEDDYVIPCRLFGSGRDGVFRLTLPARSDVRVTAAASGGGTAVMLRDSPCASDAAPRACSADLHGASTVSLTAAGVPAGTYWVIVENDLTRDVTVTAAATPAM